MSTVGKLAMEYRERLAQIEKPDSKPGCGRVLGHGESCVQGHLCAYCVETYRLNDQNETLQSMIEQLGRDAARYRYIRNRRPTWQKESSSGNDASWVDQQIDKAMKETA